MQRTFGDRSPTKSEYMSICQNHGIALRANATLGGATADILSKSRICCGRLVIIIPLEVNYLIMVL